MQAVTGVFSSQAEAEQVVGKLQESGLHKDRVTLLTPGAQTETQLESVPVDTAEQPGIGKAIGALVGGTTGLSAGLVAAAIPGVGMVTALGILGAAVLTAAGAGVGAAVGGSLENDTSRGLPEDEIFVYEDALRKGRSVVMVLAENDDEVGRVRELLKSQGAESVDDARDQWWIGLRSAEQEHYSKSGGKFSNDEKFYRVGFEAALHSRNRCREFDQVSSEMANNIEELERAHPGQEVSDAFTRGYQRGREYYERMCEESKAA